MNLKEYFELNKAKTSQAKLARKLKVPTTTISSIVNGRRGLSIFFAKEIETAIKGAVKWYEIMEYCYLEKLKRKKLSSK